jgi:predicted RNase H-like HicB family nuclease
MKELSVAFEYKLDERWTAEIMEIPGCVACGSTPAEAGAEARLLAALFLSWKEGERELEEF